MHPPSNTKLTLYCVAFNIRTRKGWRPGGLQYINASDAATAKAEIIRSRSGQLIDVIAVGPAIGYHVEDKQGKVLSA